MLGCRLGRLAVKRSRFEVVSEAWFENIVSESKILVVILNWRQAPLTIECVRVLKSVDWQNLDILVIDNGSDDNSAELLAKVLSPNELIMLPENRGFAAGSNAGLRQARESGYDYALLLNNDAFPTSDMLARMIAHIGPDVALVSPKIFYEVDPERIWFAGGDRHPITLDLINTGRDLPDSPQWSVSRDVDYLLGTCLLVNLAATENCPYFDEIYFLYFEDLDWSLRLKAQGLRLRLAADAHLYHRVAASSGGLNSPWRRYHMARSSVIFWRRYAYLGRPMIILLFRLASAVKSLLLLALTGRLTVARAYLNGLRDGWIVSG